SDILLRGIRSGAGPIPADGAVLSGDGAAGQQLLDAWNRQQKGMSPKARLVVNSPVDASASLGAYPMVLQNGRPATPFGNDANLIYPQQPHTLVAWNKAGDIYLVAIDGRQTSSIGVTMAEAADFLLGLGATDGVNLDGGGGTTFVEDGRVVNRPSDPDPNHPGGYFERGATNAFVVIARPTAPPPTAPRAVTSLSVGPDGAPETASTTGPSAAPSPTSPDGGVFGPVSGAIDQATPGDLPMGPSPAGAAAAATAANPGAPTLRPQGEATGRGTGEDAMAPPTTRPDKASGGEIHRVTDALRAPVSIASSITGQVFDATLGRASTGLPSRAGEVGAGLAGALAVTTVGTRRRRRPGARSAQPRPRLPETKPSTVASAPEIEAPPTLDVPAPKVEMPPAEVEVVPAGVDGELAEFEAELAELEVIAAELGADSPAPVFFREVPGHGELRLLESGSQITPQAWRSVSSASLRPTRSP
ncbi:MAG TPA: phosphodiester glycosidase family protein, partial [Acidimicrobiia bacterium]|nr:phosphodiester glycosidase family protein [Acidimicrobiia bacterium]